MADTDITVEAVAELFARVLRSAGMPIYVEGERIHAAEVAAPDGLLPLFALEAERLAGDVFERSLGFRLEGDDDALLGVRVSQIEGAPPMSLILAFLSRATDELKAGNALSLDPLLANWYAPITKVAAASGNRIT